MKLFGVKMPKLVQRILTNRIVLYGVVILSLIYVLGFIHNRSWDNLGLFVVVGLLTTYFTKNMVIVLGAAIFMANCNVCKNFILDRIPMKFSEGMTNKDEEENMDNKEKKTEKMSNKEGNEVLYEKIDGENGDKECKKVSGDACSSTENCFTDSGCTTLKAAFSNRTVPSSQPAVIDGSDEAEQGKGERIDYAKTLELAYDNLDKMLGQDGMKSLSDETKMLAEQQKGLMESLNNMAPMIKQAKETMKGIDFKQLNKMTNMLKK